MPSFITPTIFYSFALLHLVAVKGYGISPQTIVRTASLSSSETFSIEKPVVEVVIDPQPSEYDFQNHIRDQLLFESPGTMTIPYIEGRLLVDIDIPAQPSIDMWTQLITLNNAPTMYLPPDARPNSTIRTLYVARTTMLVCKKAEKHRATLIAHPEVTGPWTTQMTFSKTTRGYACGNTPPYPSSISRCMARFTTAWSFPFPTEVAGRSSSTFMVTVPGPHFGNTDPARWVNDTLIEDANWPCVDEISCEKLCEKQAHASIITAIVIGSILASTLLLLPFVYFKRKLRHPKDVRRLEKDGERTGVDLPDQTSTEGQTKLGDNKGIPAGIAYAQ